MTYSEIFDSYKNIAVFGMSTNPSKPSQTVPAFMHSKGFNIIPINPKAEHIIKKQAYPDIQSIPHEIDILNVFRPSEDVLAIVEEAVVRHKEKGDIKLIWLQEGIENNSAKELAESNGIDFIQDTCMYKAFIAQ